MSAVWYTTSAVFALVSVLALVAIYVRHRRAKARDRAWVDRGMVTRSSFLKDMASADPHTRNEMRTRLGYYDDAVWDEDRYDNTDTFTDAPRKMSKAKP